MKSRWVVLALVCLSSGRHMYAQNTQDTALSLQGYTGVLDTPNAHVQQEGTFSTLYSNQKEVVNGRLQRWQDNYFFSFGMFKFAEVGARLTNSAVTQQSTGGVRDLSVTWKLSSAAFTSHYRFAPSLAVGMQDPGSGHHFFKSTYVVGSADPAAWLRVSAGYGRGPDRMKGAFSGVELKAFDWVTLLGDYDTHNTNVGVRVTTPEIPYIRARLTALVSRPVQNSPGIALSGGFTIPLNFKAPHRESREEKTLWSALTSGRAKPSPSAQQAPSRPAYSEPSATPIVASAPSAPPVPSPSRPADAVGQPKVEAPPTSLEALQERLVKAGFVNVRVGLDGLTLVVDYENIRYNHSELDAIGVVCGIASRGAISGTEQLRLVIRRKGLALLQVETKLAKLQNWLDGNDQVPAPDLYITQDLAEDSHTQFAAGNHNAGWLKPSLMVYPSLTTLVATEYGLFDYLLAIRPELQVPLWKGATAVGRATIPVLWSGNLDDGHIYSQYRSSAQVDRLMLFQAVRMAPGLVANLGVGKVLGTTKGTLNEVSWIPKDGMNRLKIIQSWGRYDGATRNVFLGSYRVLLARQDLAFEAVAGRFWAQDKGVMISMQRYFGDTAVSLYFKDAVTPGDSQRWRQAGLRIDFPLTPRRDMKARPVQIRGHEAWSYSQETGVVSSATHPTNYIKPDLAIIPDPTQSLAVYFYDRERLNADYIRTHADRIRESWQHFRDKL